MINWDCAKYWDVANFPADNGDIETWRKQQRIDFC